MASVRFQGPNRKSPTLPFTKGGAGGFWKLIVRLHTSFLGVCIDRCPYELPIPEMLKANYELFLQHSAEAAR